MGGWGLGLGGEEKAAEDDEEDENLDWDQAQVRTPPGRVLVPVSHVRCGPAGCRRADGRHEVIIIPSRAANERCLVAGSRYPLCIDTYYFSFCSDDCIIRSRCLGLVWVFRVAVRCTSIIEIHQVVSCASPVCQAWPQGP